MAPRTKVTELKRPAKRTAVTKHTATPNGSEAGSSLTDRQIVQAAREIVMEVGVDGLTMRGLSSHLGVALGATYHHVANKRDLLLLLSQEIYQEVALPEKGTWDQRLKKLMMSMVNVVGRYPGMATFMNANAADSRPAELHRQVVELLEEAGFGARNVSVVIGALFFYAHGINSSAMSAAGASSAAMKRMFQDGLDLFLTGAQVALEQDLEARRRRSPGRRRAVTAAR